MSERDQINEIAALEAQIASLDRQVRRGMRHAARSGFTCLIMCSVLGALVAGVVGAAIADAAFVLFMAGLWVGLRQGGADGLRIAAENAARDGEWR